MTEEGRNFCHKCGKHLDKVVVLRGDWAIWDKDEGDYVEEEAQCWWQHECPDCGEVVDGGQS